MIRAPVLLALLLLAGPLASLPVEAQEGPFTSLDDQLVFDPHGLGLPAGEEMTQVLRLANRANASSQITVEARGPAAAWLTLDPAEQTMAQTGIAAVQVTAQVPEAAEPGTTNATLHAELTSRNRTHALEVPVRVEVTDQAVRRMGIHGWTPGPTETGGRLWLSANLTNLGNVPITPEVQVQVADDQGRVLAARSNASLRLAIGHQQATLVGFGDHEVPAGNHTMRLQVDLPGGEIPGPTSGERRLTVYPADQLAVLTLSSAELSPQHPGPGGTVQVILQVRNNALEPVTAHLVWQVTREGERLRGAQTPPTTIAPGRTSGFLASFQVPTDGTYAFEATVEHDEGSLQLEPITFPVGTGQAPEASRTPAPGLLGLALALLAACLLPGHRRQR